ncbi:MAG TPA: tetratricopeptide repeat protein [Verrucomicrobiae bacterium]|nr:tetratricopeptide repeat protein [Verrucomicrobiae bacterium]
MIEFPRRQQSLLLCACLALATVAVYWPAHRCDFINYDDNLYVAENPHLRAGVTLRGLSWAMTTPLDLWMPVTWLVRLIEYQLFGSNAGADHLVNVLFHVANTVLLFGVLQRLTGAPWRSALAAALFALHPLHVEAVAWVTGLKDVLSTCLGLLTIWAYARYVEEPAVRGSRRKIFFGLTLTVYALALMAKPMMVTLPLVLLLLDYWPLGRTHWAKAARARSGRTTRKDLEQNLGQLVKEKIPFLVLAAGACAATVWAQRAAGPLVSLENLPLGIRVGNALLSYVGYVGKTIWPTGLAVFYPFDAHLSLVAASVAGTVLVGLTAAVIWRVRRAPWLAVGWFWYLGTLVPVIGLVQAGVVPAMADRYSYVPSVGLFIMLCWSVPDGARQRRTLRVTVGSAAVAALAVCAVLARIQIGYWKNTETLFRHALNVTRNNWLAHNNLGIALGQAGKIDEAVAQCEQALRIRPGFPEAHYNLGLALGRIGRIQEAVAHYEQALRIKPDFAEAHYSLGNILLTMGDVENAIVHYRQALRVKPDFAEAHYNLGVALQQQGRAQEAMQHYEAALRLNPTIAGAHNNLGILLKDLGRAPEAIEHFEAALRIQPEDAGTHYNLGGALEQVGRFGEAMDQYEQALQIKPDFTDAQTRLARLRAAR